MAEAILSGAMTLVALTTTDVRVTLSMLEAVAAVETVSNDSEDGVISSVRGGLAVGEVILVRSWEVTGIVPTELVDAATTGDADV